jgi:hypothetical protein
MTPDEILTRLEAGLARCRVLIARTGAVRVPLPLRKHVLGSAKRRLHRPATRLGDL